MAAKRTAKMLLSRYKLCKSGIHVLASRLGEWCGQQSGQDLEGGQDLESGRDLSLYSTVTQNHLRWVLVLA